jgi:hypothetical protein
MRSHVHIAQERLRQMLPLQEADALMNTVFPPGTSRVIVVPPENRLIYR